MERLMMERLKQWKNCKNRKPLILKGVRQVGKTFLLKEFGLREFQKVHYFNFEKQNTLRQIFKPDLDVQRILVDLEFFLDQSIDQKEDLIIFDEIQECPEALISLKYFYEELPHLAICSAGSLLGIYLNQGSFPVGKIEFETLRPMSFEEFLMALEDKGLPFLQKKDITQPLSEVIHQHLFELFKIYLVVGGLPEVVLCYKNNKDDLFKAFQEVRKKQKDLIDGYYGDIAKHAGKINAMHIDRIFRTAAMQISSLQDGGLSKFKIKGVVPGVSHYDRLAGAIDWLLASGMLNKISVLEVIRVPLKSQARENFFKLVTFDVGILGAMAEIRPQVLLSYDFGSYKGYLAECFIAQELLFYFDESLYSYNQPHLEIEFLVDYQGQIIPIEVKAGRVTQMKSLKKFCELFKMNKAVVISAKNLAWSKGSSVQNLPLYAMSWLKHVLDRI